VGCPAHECAFCAELRDEGRVDLQSRVGRTRVIAKQLLVEDGGADADVVTLVDGVVMSFMTLAGGLRQVTGFHFPGDLLHWSRDSFTSRVTLQALTPASICRFDGDRLRELCYRYPELASRLLDLASIQVDAAREHMAVLGRATAEQRIAWFLLGLASRRQNQGDIAPVIDLPMSRADIADYLGLTVETVSRMFTRLTSAGLLRLSTPKQVVVINRRELADRARITAPLARAEFFATHGGNAYVG
jgi:CRP/FNR family transcriptional regulator